MKFQEQHQHDAIIVCCLTLPRRKEQLKHVGLDFSDFSDILMTILQSPTVLHNWCQRGLILFYGPVYRLIDRLVSSPSLFLTLCVCVQDSFPLKVRGIHLVNEPMFFRPVFAMIRPFLPDKIKQRVSILFITDSVNHYADTHLFVDSVSHALLIVDPHARC